MIISHFQLILCCSNTSRNVSLSTYTEFLYLQFLSVHLYLKISFSFWTIYIWLYSDILTFVLLKPCVNVVTISLNFCKFPTEQENICALENYTNLWFLTLYIYHWCIKYFLAYHRPLQDSKTVFWEVSSVFFHL